MTNCYKTSVISTDKIKRKYHSS